MEIPERLKQHLDGESVQSAVNLGDEDVICFTPTRTLLYRGEGLLSDESVEEFSHNIERLELSRGRRKTTFTLEYVDSVDSFSVSTNRTDQVLHRLLAGVLAEADALADEESVQGVFLFSELTVIITDARLVKHIGTYVWDPDYEEYPFSAVTNLGFEEGSVATQIVLSLDGRQQRIKAPSDKAKKLRQTLTNALFGYYDVDSLEELNESISPDQTDAEPEDDSSGLGLDDSISPLVDDDEQQSQPRDTVATDSATAESGESADDDKTEVLSVGPRAGDSSDDDEPEESASESEPGDAEIRHESAPAVDPAEIEEIQDQLDALTATVEQQNETIEKQQETIEQLIEELRKRV